MTRRGVMGLLVGGATVALGGCGMSGSASYHFRMTVEVQTPQGVQRGSGVFQVFASVGERIGDVSGKSGGLKGEAVVIDLPDGPVFVLLKLPDARGDLDSAATVALDPKATGSARTDYLDAVRHLGGWFGGASAELPRSDWPMMVRFRDINDSKTVERVDPAAIGVKRIALETTGDAVTTGIEKRFPPWFSELVTKKAEFDGHVSNGIVSSNDLAAIMGPADFSTEIRK